MSASLRGGVLRVHGTDGDDAIVIQRSESQPHKLQVTVNGESRLFRAGKVHRIRVYAHDGDDSVEFSEAVRTRATIVGGAGDDEILGGSGKDLILGGDGEDDLAGGPNRDKLFAGEGEDVFNSTDARREMKDRGEGEDGIRVALEEVSPVVRAAVLDLLDGNDFLNLLEEVDDGAVVYELEWEAPGPRSAKINLAGEVIELEVEIDPATLPDAVKSAIATKYPTGEITEAETLELPDTPLRYEVEVAVPSEGVRRELVITPAGEILADDVEGPIED
jgi:hypothetical protein